MYITRFFRLDGNPSEDYYYHSYKEARHHLDLFAADDSGLYLAIGIVDEAIPEKTLCVLPFNNGKPQEILDFRKGHL